MSVLTDVDIRKELGKNIVIHPMSEDSISPLGYDLRIGMVSILHFPDEDPIESGNIVVPPKCSIQILTEERVWLSSKIIGTLHSRGSFSARGLILNSTTVDPNWKGQMTFLMFNSSHQEVEIEVGSRFMTLIFHYASSPTATSPNTNPIRVAESHQFSRAVAGGNVPLNTEFENQIQAAIKPTFLQITLDGIVGILNYFKSFVYTDFIQVILIFLLIVDLITLVGFPLGLFDIFKAWFNLSGEYVPQVWIGQLSLLVVLLVGIRGGNRN